MGMLIDEMSVLKAVMVQIDAEHALLATLQYHSEPGENGKKFNSAKASKRWLARVDTIENFKAMVKSMSDDSVRLEKSKWPDDPASWHICFGNDSTNGRFADFLEVKLKKMKSWTDGMNILDGWQSKTPKRIAGYNLNAKYDTEDYLDKSGAKVSLKDRDALLKHVGQNLWKPFSRKKAKFIPAPPAPPPESIKISSAPAA